MRSIVALLLIATGCASVPPTRPGAPGAPEAIDVDRLVPPTPPTAPAPSSATRFEDYVVMDGRCPPGLSGILVSEAIYAETIAGLSERNRLRAESAALRRLYGAERAAFEQAVAAYGARVRKLDSELAEQRRRNSWRWAGGAVVGAAAILLGSWSASQVAR